MRPARWFPELLALALAASSCAIDARRGGAAQDSGVDAPCQAGCVEVGGADAIEDALADTDAPPGQDTDAPEDVGVDADVGEADAPEDSADAVGDVEEPGDVQVDAPLEVGGDVAPDAAAVPLLGVVTVIETRITTGTVPTEIRRGSGMAMFIDPDDLGPVPTLGTCILRMATPDAPPAFGYDAGAVEVSGVDRDFALLPAASVENRSIVYTSTLPADTESMFKDSDPVTITGAGGAELGPFTGTLTPPRGFRVNAPNAGAWLVGEHLEVGLNNTSDDLVLISISPLSAGYAPIAGEMVQCLLEGGSNRFTIPLTGLQLEATPRFALTVDRIGSLALEVGASTVQLNVIRDEAVLLRGGGL